MYLPSIGVDPRSHALAERIPIGTCTQIVPLDALYSFTSRTIPVLFVSRTFFSSCPGISAVVSLHS